MNEVLAQKGRRVLACCEKEIDGAPDTDVWTNFETDPANFPLGNDADRVEKAIESGLKQNSY